MILIGRYKSLLVLSTSFLLTACGGSGSGSSNPAPPTNRAPSAAAGINQNVDELSLVTLDGSTSSDPDAGTSLTYAWSQTVGAAITLSSSTASQPTFDAPDVTAVDTPVTLTFQLTVSDGSLSSSDLVDIVVDDIGVGVNSPPTAAAGADQIVAELTTANLDGSASQDPDGDTLSFAWLQMAGPNVTLSDANAEQPSFPAPDVAVPTVLTFQLTVDDGTDNAVDVVDITVQEGLSQVTVAGAVSYEFVPASHNNSTCFGLDFPNTVVMPIRAATVQLLDASDNVLAQMASGDDGSYSFDNIAASTDVRIRVRAELKRGGAPNWDVEVRDNVDISLPPPPLETRPLYVAQWPLFNTGITHITDADFTAMTGWDSASSSYTSDADRVAAPFAILDTIYTGMRLVLGVDTTASFAPLDAFWSVDNTRTDGSPTDIDMGEIGGSFYSSGIDSLFLVGDALVDTGEFDFYVTLHEWGHYFEDNFSRSDSVGGSHVIGGLVEARVSFGEGWGTAVAAMASGDPMACNTGAASGDGSWGFNIEDYNRGAQGWYNEISVAGLILDLFDTNDDGVDNNSIGFAPIYDVMTRTQTTTEAFTTLFSFSSLLRPNLTLVEQGFLDTLLATENVETTGLDIWGSTQNNNNEAVNQSQDVLPLYTDFSADGSVLNICSNNFHDPNKDGNKPAEYRYLRMNVATQGRYRIVLSTDNVDGGNAPSQPPGGFDCDAAFEADPDDPEVHTYSDPDYGVFLNGVQKWGGYSCTPNTEDTLTNTLVAGNYLLDIRDYRFGDDQTIDGYPSEVCFAISATLN
jgi:K319L-like, PKD domain